MQKWPAFTQKSGDSGGKRPDNAETDAVLAVAGGFPDAVAFFPRADANRMTLDQWVRQKLNAGVAETHAMHAERRRRNRVPRLASGEPQAEKFGDAAQNKRRESNPEQSMIPGIPSGQQLRHRADVLVAQALKLRMFAPGFLDDL